MAIGTILDNIRFPSFAYDKMTPKEGAFAATPRPNTGRKRHVSHLSASCLNHRPLPPRQRSLPVPRLRRRRHRHHHNHHHQTRACSTRACSPTTSTTTAAPDLRWSVFGGVFGSSPRFRPWCPRSQVTRRTRCGSGGAARPPSATTKLATSTGKWTNCHRRCRLGRPAHPPPQT